MDLKIVMKMFGKALPVIIAHGPAIAEAVRQIKAALKKPVAAEPARHGPVPATSAE